MPSTKTQATKTTRGRTAVSSDTQQAQWADDSQDSTTQSNTQHNYEATWTSSPYPNLDWAMDNDWVYFRARWNVPGKRARNGRGPTDTVATTGHPRWFNDQICASITVGVPTKGEAITDDVPTPPVRRRRPTTTGTTTTRVRRTAKK